MKKSAAFTLIELLVVIAVIVVIVVPLIITYQSSRASQALRSSAHQLQDKITSAHLFARDVRDKKAWGIKSGDGREYHIVSGSPDTWEIDANYSLDSQVEFESAFSIWFEAGTGRRSDGSSEIRLKNSRGTDAVVTISEEGVSEIIQED